MTEQLAIMKDVHFGVRYDMDVVSLYFQTYISEGTGALQILPVEKAVEVIEAYRVPDASKLDGKPCWVNYDQDSRTMVFSRPWKE